MGDLINRDKFLETHGGMWSMSMYVGCASDLKAFNEGRKSVIDMLKNEEPVDAEPVRHGKWIAHETSTGISAFGFHEMTVLDLSCSYCGVVIDASECGYKFCPNCGAKMDGGTNDAENRA